MKKYFLITITLLLFTITAYSKVFRVGYNGTPLKGVDYTTITEVNDSVAKAGDTIQVYGSQNGTINKRLVILGFGYNLNAHPGYQSNPGLASYETNNPSTVSITFELGSDSSIVEGCLFYGNIKVNKVVVRRCSGSISLDNSKNSISDIKAISCVGLSINNQEGFPCKNIQVYNCLGNYYQYSATTITLKGSESTGIISNCIGVFPYGNDKSKMQVINSIFLPLYSNFGDYTLSWLLTNMNSIYDNNIFVISEPIPTLPGSKNKWSQPYDSLFVAPNPDPKIGSLDENNYQLRPNSPAKTHGIDLSGKATDCGIFGGELAYRYRIGGQPAIPTFYKLSVPSNSASTNPYNITVSVRSNN